MDHSNLSRDSARASTLRPQPSGWGRGLRIAQVAELLGASKNSIRNWSNPNSPYFDDQFPLPSKIGGRVLIWSETEVIAFLHNHRQTGSRLDALGGRQVDASHKPRAASTKTTGKGATL